MTEYERIFASMTSVERELYHAIGGVIPPCTPLSDPGWVAVPLSPGTVDPGLDRQATGQCRKSWRDTSRYAVLWHGQRWESFRLAGEGLGVSERTLRDMAYRGRELRGHLIEMVLKRKSRKAA